MTVGPEYIGRVPVEQSHEAQRVDQDTRDHQANLSPGSEKGWRMAYDGLLNPDNGIQGWKMLKA